MTPPRSHGAKTGGNPPQEPLKQDPPRHPDEQAQLREGQSEMARVVGRNIRALLDRRRKEEHRKTVQQRLASRITVFAGSMYFVYLHLGILVLWVVINLGMIRPIPRFDPSFVLLATAASVEAIFLSTFVLITQNRMAVLADQRADLDLQISLLAEHEVTRLLTLVRALAERTGIEQSRDPELKELEQDVRPERVLDEMEQTSGDEKAA